MFKNQIQTCFWLHILKPRFQVWSRFKPKKIKQGLNHVLTNPFTKINRGFNHGKHNSCKLVIFCVETSHKSEMNMFKNQVMASNVDQIMDQLKTLNLTEATELVELMETVFKVDASGPSFSANVVGNANANADQADQKASEEKASFDVVVEDVPSDKRVAVLKVIRKLTDLGLADAKAFTTSLPKALKEGLGKDEAEEAKTELEAVGAKVSLN